ncbi:non-heme iron oxygenase ferredoxin subunit [Paracoccus pantotrophus]|uniref:non-heme iron oxygenase ferredoxin subunit n=1 Tax=Paracoccus pantotrophus TaxID=82367 RepID=UPI000685AAFA|nr:non-heme iron oxygenase ferredoxin subunit [Paracoccus pantotrophus]
MQNNEWVNFCALDDIPEEGMHHIEMGEKWIVVYRLDDAVYATDNICPHAFALLSDGWLEDGVIECPLHGALFDVKNGAVLRGPADCAIRTYPVKIEQGRVFVDMAVQSA